MGGGNALPVCGKLRVAALATVGALAISAITFTVWVHSLGPVPLGESLEFSTVVVDRNGRLLRPYATPDGRWRLPATVKDVDPRYLDLLIAYEDKRFRQHHGVDPIAVARAAAAARQQRPHRVGRLDAHHAGRAPARAAHGPHISRQAAPGGARGSARAAR